MMSLLHTAFCLPMRLCQERKTLKSSIWTGRDGEKNGRSARRSLKSCVNLFAMLHPSLFVPFPSCLLSYRITHPNEIGRLLTHYFCLLASRLLLCSQDLVINNRASKPLRCVRTRRVSRHRVRLRGTRGARTRSTLSTTS